MSNVTVRQLADVVGIPVDRLVEQLGEAGMEIKDPDQGISNKDKMQLLQFLRKSRSDLVLSCHHWRYGENLNKLEVSGKKWIFPVSPGIPVPRFFHSPGIPVSPVFLSPLHP